MTALPPYTRTPVTTPDGVPVIGWSGPSVPRPRRCWCGRPIPQASDDDCCCAEHDAPEEAADPDVCGDCHHQRAFHFPEHDGLCFGHDCDCPGFEETA